MIAFPITAEHSLFQVKDLLVWRALRALRGLRIFVFGRYIRELNGGGGV
jgi:hypothetical protein